MHTVCTILRQKRYNHYRLSYDCSYNVPTLSYKYTRFFVFDLHRLEYRFYAVLSIVQTTCISIIVRLFSPLSIHFSRIFLWQSAIKTKKTCKHHAREHSLPFVTPKAALERRKYVAMRHTWLLTTSSISCCLMQTRKMTA